MNFLEITKNIYNVLPGWLKSAHWDRIISSKLPYNSYFFKFVERTAIESAPLMAKSIMVDLKPAKVIDAGCGTGALINELKILGCQVSGLEYSDTAINLCLARGLDVHKFNLEKDFITTKCEYDVSISLEVAEHLSEDFSDHYVELLTNLAPVLVFSAAPPGQFGFGHINEQPAEYWIKKFKNCNFEFDHELSMKWRKNWADSHKVTWWYYQNLMIFRKS